ncbi:hypothetical protein [Proteiniborus sp.]|uniref:hypothetical protein n=1 Tax=Proteiniborus sp. TaxID=2079015 RepID=UPI00333071CA
MYKYGNIYFDSTQKIQFRTVDELANFKGVSLKDLYDMKGVADSELNEELVIQHNDYGLFYNPEAPPFNLEGKANVRYLQEYEEDLIDLLIRYPNLYIMPALQTC